MKRGKALGIGFAVIAVIIVMGIATLPDEVLLESPRLDTSESLPSEMVPMENLPVDISVEQPIEVVEEEQIEVVEEEQIEVVEEEQIEVVEEEQIEVVEESENPDESEGNIIKVTITDGVGGKQR
jgi:hypothetical protein